jgi:hypothetical protein
MVDERQIEEDYDRAKDKIDYYSTRLHSIATIRSECFTTARTSFADFLQLKDGQDSIMKYTGIILLAASVVLPEIGIALAIAKSAAKAEQFAVQLERIEQLEKNAELVEKGLAKVEKARATDELKTKKKEEKEVAEQKEKAIGMFENSMKVVNEDNELLLKSDELLKFVRDTITGHKYYYLMNQDKYNFMMLQNMADNILAGTDIKLTEMEITQITKRYLYELVKSYCQTYCRSVWSHPFGSNNGDYRIDGLNETQQNWLIDNFGIYIPRGKYFLATPIVDLKRTLLSWGARQVEEVTPPLVSWNKLRPTAYHVK